MTGLDPGWRENVVQRPSHPQKGVRRSRDRGCKGHRILRRVLVGGRHLGLSRAIFFHERVVTATLAASSRRTAPSLERASGEARYGSAKAHRRSGGTRTRERRQRCQRLDRNGRRGDKLPTLESSRVNHQRRERFKRQGSVCPAVIRRSVRECREALGPLVSCVEPKTPRDVHAGESRGASRERTRYG